jgi:hypothetical protein
LQKYTLFFYSPTILAKKNKKCAGREVEYKEKYALRANRP